MTAAKYRWATSEDGEVWTDEEVAILRKHINQPGYVQRCMEDLERDLGITHRTKAQIYTKMSYMPGFKPMSNVEKGAQAVLYHRVHMPGRLNARIVLPGLPGRYCMLCYTVATVCMVCMTGLLYVWTFTCLFTCLDVSAGQISAQARGQRPWTDEDVAILRKHMDQPGYIQRCMAELKAPRSASVISNKVNKLQVNKLEGQYL